MDVVPIEKLSDNMSRKRLKKKNEIIDYLLARLEKQSIHNLSLNKLAKEMDYSPAALYRYFPSWGTLLSEALKRVIIGINNSADHFLKNANTHIQNNQFSTSTALIIQLHALAESFYQFSETYPGQFSLINHLLAESQIIVNEQEAEITLKDAMHLFGKLSTLISQGVDNETFTEGDLLARTISYWSAIQGLLQTRKLARFAKSPPNYQNTTHDLIEGILLGWGATRTDTAIARHYISASIKT